MAGMKPPPWCLKNQDNTKYTKPTQSTLVEFKIHGVI